MTPFLWLIFFPFAASVLSFLSLIQKKGIAVIVSLIPLLLLFSRNWIGDSIDSPWIPTLDIEFTLKMDSLALLFVYLTAILIPIALLASPSHLPSASLFYGFVFLLQGFLFGFFTAHNLLLFLLFWEAMLFPIYFIISIWGGEKKRHAALQFLIYMIAGSSLMILAVLALYFGGSTFDFEILARVAESIPYAGWVAAIFFLAFSVKTPLFPFHAWLPDAYCEAPTYGTILLSALLSKAGIFGFLRIGLTLFPSFLREFSPFLLGLAITGVLYGGLAAWRQTDYKRLIAYSSFSHVNFILAGLFVWNQAAQEGAILQALNHGITIAALFLVVGYLEERLHSTKMTHHGLAKWMPRLCWLTLIFVLSSIALPGTNNFIGELLILFGLFGEHPWLTALLGLSVILSVIYMLSWMQRLYFGESHSFQHTWVDIRRNEFLIALPLIALIFWIGVYPQPVLKHISLIFSKGVS